MKTALKITIKNWIDGKLVETKEKIVCGYCRSGQVYNLKKEKAIFCRVCGNTSRLEEK